jgi:hypothetical protein
MFFRVPATIAKPNRASPRSSTTELLVMKIAHSLQASLSKTKNAPAKTGAFSSYVKSCSATIETN